jgi:hypothetical protein
MKQIRRAAFLSIFPKSSDRILSLFAQLRMTGKSDWLAETSIRECAQYHFKLPLPEREPTFAATG